MGLKTFYFTFGTDPSFPFKRGWVEVQAENETAARQIFSAYFPNRQNGCLNCAFVYTEDVFKKTCMYSGEYGDRCHAKIGIGVID